MTDDDQNWPLQVRHLVDGDDEAVRTFWNEYGARLQALAARHLNAAVQRRESAEDVAQSVCRTFFRRARQGEFSLDDSGSLWRLLCVITITKTREKARFHGREKRNWRKEQTLASGTDESRPGLERLSGHEPDPFAVAEFADQMELITRELDEEEQAVLRMKLDRMCNREIADELGCSERTVRRIASRLQQRLRSVLEDSLSHM